MAGQYEQNSANLIPRDILICDWKYVKAPPTPANFAIKGYCSTEDNDAKNTTDTFKALFAEIRKNNAPKIVGG
jgi:hypothetical protein